MVKKKSKGNKKKSFSIPSTSNTSTTTWKELKPVLLLDFVRELVSIKNVASLSDTYVSALELAERNVKAAIFHPIHNLHPYQEFAEYLEPFAAQLSVPLWLIHYVLSLVESASKTTWSRAQENFPQNEPPPQKKDKEVAREIHTDNSQIQKSTQPIGSTTEPIIVDADNAMNLDDQQPASEEPWTIQTKKKVKRGTVTKKTMNNNIISEQQKGQVRSIMIYDIPATWSHDEVLNHLKDWGQVLEISFKKQHKYQSVWTKMILRPLIDTNYVLRTWWQQLGPAYVRWFPGDMRLNDRKQRENFRAKAVFPNFPSDEDLVKGSWKNGLSLVDFYKAKSWKSYKSKSSNGTPVMEVILYFASQDQLLDALDKKDGCKLSIPPPLPKQTKMKKKTVLQSDKKDKNKAPKETKKVRPKSNNRPKEVETRTLINALIKLLS